MDVNKYQTQETIKSVVDGRLNFPDCIAALNAAPADFAPGLTGEQNAPLAL
jgi:hypothetical protein